MSTLIIEDEWREALSSMLEQLSEEEYKKMLNFLTAIPEGTKKSTERVCMPQKIISFYGCEDSVLTMERIMKKIPRKDGAIQSPLRRFVKLITDEEANEKKRNGGEMEDNPTAGKRRKQHESSTNMNPNQLPSKIVPASPDDKAVKVTSRSTIGLCGPLNVTHEAEEEAELLLAPPVSSIREAKACDPASFLTIQGTVNRDYGMETISVAEEGKKKKKKIEKRVLSLEDETGSIDVQLWGNVAKSCVKVGDCVKITNVKVNVYFNSISLKSTGRTALKAVTTAAQETTVLTMQAIQKSTKKQVNLMAVTSGGQQTFTVATTCLTKFFDVPYDKSFKENLLQKIPTTVEAVVHGSEILSIKK